MTDSEWQPIEAAAKALCDWQEPKTCETTCDYCQMQVRAAVIAYLRAMAEQGPSKNMLLATITIYTTKEAFVAMLRAHIAELEATP